MADPVVDTLTIYFGRRNFALHLIAENAWPLVDREVIGVLIAAALIGFGVLFDWRVFLPADSLYTLTERFGAMVVAIGAFVELRGRELDPALDEAVRAANVLPAADAKQLAPSKTLKAKADALIVEYGISLVLTTRPPRAVATNNDHLGNAIRQLRVHGLLGDAGLGGHKAVLQLPNAGTVLELPVEGPIAREALREFLPNLVRNVDVARHVLFFGGTVLWAFGDLIIRFAYSAVPS